MLAREEIISYLAANGCATSTQIHNHLEDLGFKRCTSMGVLSKMVTSGVVLRAGHHQEYACRLNKSVKHNVNAGGAVESRVRPKPKTPNAVFDDCRTVSPMHQFNELLKAARGNHA